MAAMGIVEPQGVTAVAPLHTLRRAEPSVALAKEGKEKAKGLEQGFWRENSRE